MIPLIMFSELSLCPFPFHLFLFLFILYSLFVFSSQVLGVLAKQMEPDLVGQIVSQLLVILSLSEWQIKHSALIGLKYTLAVREDLAAVLLPKVQSHLFSALRSSEDEIIAVVADTLLPLSS